MSNTSKADFRPVRVGPAQPPSAVVSELLAAFRDPDPDLDHIVELITIEPTLSAEVLRRSNSVRFGGTAPATDVFEAVSRIGMDEAHNALVALNDSPRPVAPTNSRSVIWR